VHGVLARITAEKPTLSLDPEASAFTAGESDEEEDDDSGDPYADDDDDDSARTRESHPHS